MGGPSLLASRRRAGQRGREGGGGVGHHHCRCWRVCLHPAQRIQGLGGDERSQRGQRARSPFHSGSFFFSGTLRIGEKIKKNRSSQNRLRRPRFDNLLIFYTSCVTCPHFLDSVTTYPIGCYNILSKRASLCKWLAQWIRRQTTVLTHSLSKLCKHLEILG